MGVAWPITATAEQHDSCVTCHLATGDARLMRPVEAFRDDIHAARGFSCAACHGGDPQAAGMEAMDPARGYIGIPERQDLPRVCGHCHSDAQFMQRYNPALPVDQVAEYSTSAHGRRLKESNDPKVATCASCHPAHAIRPASDPTSSVHPLRVAELCGRCHADTAYMQPYGIPTDQLQQYRESVHWRTLSVQGDLSAPTCSTCHGNHGAAPRGVTWVGNVCGQCHTVQADFFHHSVHAPIFVQMGVPGCATCHSNHAITATHDAMLGRGDSAVCTTCHTAESTGGQVAVDMQRHLDTLHREYDKARDMLRRAEHAGMEVSQAQFELQGAKTALVKARAAVHTFTAAAVQQETAPGLSVSARAYARGVKALDELRFRRTGLGVSVLIILAIIVGLRLKIRQLDRRETRQPRPEGHGP
jgi:predicted CXXCH cytochrome family protein